MRTEISQVPVQSTGKSKYQYIDLSRAGSMHILILQRQAKGFHLLMKFACFAEPVEL
jgi:hypothetical protein